MNVESMQRPVEPVFDMHTFTETIYDEDLQPHQATISFEGYCYDGALRLVKLSVKTLLTHVDQEQVINLLEFIEGKRVKLECKMQLV